MAQLNKTATIINEILDGQRRSVAAQESAILGSELIDGTGWTLGTGWSGNTGTGFIHTAGNTANLSRTLSTTGTKLFQLEFTVTSPTANSSITVKIGNSESYDLYIGAVSPATYRCGIKSVSNGDLVFIPDNTFDGTITAISCKEITGISTPVKLIKDSTNTSVLEQRNSLASLLNVFIGLGAGKYNTTGYENVGVGNSSLESNTTGFWNTGVGKDSLKVNTVGSRNIAIGYNTLTANISGQRNQAIGTFSLVRNTIGNRNAGLGSDTLFYNTVGSDNNAIGFSSQYSNVSGKQNVAIGTASLYNNIVSDGSVSIGYNSLYNCTGEKNIALGYNSGAALTTGSSNIFIGNGGAALRTGSNCVFIGLKAVAPSSSISDYLNIENLIFGITSVTPNVGIGESDPGGGVLTYNPTLHIGSTAKPGYLILGTSATANAAAIGDICFFNKANSNAGGTTRKTVANIRSFVTTTDANADADAGAYMNFWTKAEAGVLTERLRIESNGRLLLLAISDYADNAAAVGAGLAVGTFYKTGDLLKIVHA